MPRKILFIRRKIKNKKNKNGKKKNQVAKGKFPLDRIIIGLTYHIPEPQGRKFFGILKHESLLFFFFSLQISLYS